MGENEKKVPSAREVIVALQNELAEGEQRNVDEWLEDERKLEDVTESQK